MKQPSFAELLDKRVPAVRLTDFIIHELSAFNLGKIVDFNFLCRSSVGGYCRSLGFAKNRNWSMLALDKIAPKSPRGPNVVPEREAKAVLASYAIPSICACCNLKIKTSHNRTYFLTFYRKEDDTNAPRRLATFGSFNTP